MSEINRRAVLAGATAAAAIPTAAVATLPNLEPDPIFAAIQRHKDAYVAHGAADTVDGDLDAAANADFDARDALLEVQPTTIAGAVALLRYSWEFCQQPGEESIWGEAGGYKLHPHLADALEEMAARA
jgi:hypothetical protein